MVLAVAKDSPLLGREDLMEALQNQVWISREAGSGTQEYLESFLETHHIKPKNVMVFSSNFAVQEAVKNGLGITLISEYVVEHAAYDKELATIPLGKERMRKFSYILPKDAEVTPATLAFMTAMASNQRDDICIKTIEKFEKQQKNTSTL